MAVALIQEINAVDEIDFARLTISNDSLIQFTDKDKAMMRDLPKRECEYGTQQLRVALNKTRSSHDYVFSCL